MSNIPVTIPPLPQSWSDLTFRQLCDVWRAKMRFGGNQDAARAAALLALAVGEGLAVRPLDPDPATGEPRYELSSPLPRREGQGGGSASWVCSPRELSWLSREALPWLAYPYGDAGDPEERDAEGKVVKEAREGRRGLVNENGSDALDIGEQGLVVCGRTIVCQSEWEAMGREGQQRLAADEWRQTATGERQDTLRTLLPADTGERQLQRLVRREWRQMDERLRSRVFGSPRFVLRFTLPQWACNDLTWEQYRSLQAVAAQLFREGVADGEALELQAQFTSYCLVPEGEPDEKGNPFHYSAYRAEQLVPFWKRHLERRAELFSILFQAYQTAMHYYERAFPLLFGGAGGKKSDQYEDALTGEVGTLNAIMKYQGYVRQQEVYDTNLPIVLSILNTMTKEAKEIEKMNSKIKRK